MTQDAAGLLDGPFSALAEAVSSGRATARDVAEASLARAAKARDLYGAFLSIDDDAALRQAEAVDRRVAAGERLPLAGVPLAVKDNINVAGRASTAGSRILAGFVAPDDATCVARLVAAGAVVVGKTNCDEFGMGSSNENSAYGPARNPWDPSRVPGGSSGGSAAAVAARAVPLAIGTDTGGSVRQPAALCGLVGLEADLRARLALRPHRVRVVVRPGGRAHPERPRRRARVHGHGGRRPEGRDVARDAGPGRRDGPRGGGARAGGSGSSPRRSPRRAACTRRSRSRSRARPTPCARPAPP